jgi:hypothetical protein
MHPTAMPDTCLSVRLRPKETTQCNVKRGPNALGRPVNPLVYSDACLRNCLLFGLTPKLLIPGLVRLDGVGRCHDRFGAEVITSNRGRDRIRNYLVRRNVIVFHVRYYPLTPHPRRKPSNPGGRASAIHTSRVVTTRTQATQVSASPARAKHVSASCGC